MSSLALCFMAAWLMMGVASAALSPGERRYPPSALVIDVTKPPYLAKGDGTTDDTEAIQRAIHENVGWHRMLYFPNGTYLIRRTLTWPKKWNGRENWGFTFLCGQHRDHVILRLADGTFTDAAKPQALMGCGGFGSADWFHNYVENLTFDIGLGNPGATALQFYSNNSGAVRNCRFVAGEGSGAVGLDLAHRDMNGPLLVKDCEVIGFRVGIATGHAVNSQTFENITLRDQREAGLQNQGQTLSIHGLTSHNAVPAVITYGRVALVTANLAGRGNAATLPAVVNYNGGRVFLRDLRTSGYARAVADVTSPDLAAAFRITGEDRPGSRGPNLDEYSSHPTTMAFPSPSRSLRLPVKNPPAVPWEDPTAWANADAFGADPSGQNDSSEAVQKALDSGATTVFLPGSYHLRRPVTIRGKVRRIVGLGGMINYGRGLHPDFRLVDGEAPAVSLEHFGNIHGGLEIDTRRTLILRSVADCDLTSTSAAQGGEIFLEDVVTHDLRLRGQSLWARQLNIENEGTHLLNVAGRVWILGYKTERGGTLLETREQGRSEVLGGFSYTTTAGGLAPMFINDRSSLFGYLGEVCYNGDPFRVIVRETRGGETKEIKRGEGEAMPYSGYENAK